MGALLRSDTLMEHLLLEIQACLGHIQLPCELTQIPEALGWFHRFVDVSLHKKDQILFYCLNFDTGK